MQEERRGRKLRKLEMAVPERLAVGMGGGSPQGCVGASRSEHIGSGLGENSQVCDQGPKPVHIWLLLGLAVNPRARQHGTMGTRARTGSGLRLAHVLAYTWG